MTQDEQFEYAKREIGSKIETWAALYEFFDQMMARVRDTMHPAHVFDGLFTMYAFMVALKEMPDEGDIKKLVERTLYIMVYESMDKLGAKLTIMTPEELQKNLSEHALGGLSAFASAELPNGKRLH